MYVYIDMHIDIRPCASSLWTRPIRPHAEAGT